MVEKMVKNEKEFLFTTLVFIIEFTTLAKEPKNPRLLFGLRGRQYANYRSKLTPFSACDTISCFAARHLSVCLSLTPLPYLPRQLAALSSFVNDLNCAQL
jgi:hypothetical protein